MSSSIIFRLAEPTHSYMRSVHIRRWHVVYHLFVTLPTFLGHPLNSYTGRFSDVCTNAFAVIVAAGTRVSPRC